MKERKKKEKKKKKKKTKERCKTGFTEASTPRDTVQRSIRNARKPLAGARRDAKQEIGFLLEHALGVAERVEPHGLRTQR